VWLGGIPVAVLHGASQDPEVLYVFSDHLGAPRVMIDKNNGGRWRWISEPFGTTAPEEAPGGLAPVTLNLRFPGQYFDKESGLSYNYFRDYDGTIGRYVQSDPIGMEGGLNTYAYALNSPSTFVDDDGLKVRVATSDPVAAKRLMEAYARLNRSKRAREINSKLEASCEVYEIRPISKDAFYCPPGTTHPSCQGRTRVVYIDPYNMILLPTTQGMQSTPLEVTLGHELGHANGDSDDGPGMMNNVNKNENPIRRDLGLPPRTSYPVPRIVWVPIR
jgi:RHS repeat-associated protein